MNHIVTIEDKDRGIDFVLSVDFTRLPAEANVGLGEAVEIDSVRCVEVVTWLGKRAVSAYPGREDEIGLERRMGEHCLEKYRSEITAALTELRSALAAE